jgi:hypothetical protein
MLINLGFALCSLNFHLVPTSYMSMLEEIEVKICSAPRLIMNVDDVESHDDVFDASQTNGRSKRTVNYMEIEYIALVTALDNVTLDAMTNNDQLEKILATH